jgi:hypothetical protein
VFIGPVNYGVNMGFGVVKYKCLICMNINDNIIPSG